MNLKDILIPILTAFISGGGIYGILKNRETVRGLEIENMKSLITVNEEVIKELEEQNQILKDSYNECLKSKSQ